jgi:hypothetical protein
MANRIKRGRMKRVREKMETEGSIDCTTNKHKTSREARVEEWSRVADVIMYINAIQKYFISCLNLIVRCGDWFLAWVTLQPRRWRQHGSPKYWLLSEDHMALYPRRQSNS